MTPSVACRAAWAAVLLAPLVWLGPCLLGDRTFVPFDLAQYPPVAATLTPEQLAEVKAHSNYDVTEIPITFLPEWRFAQQELSAGRLPEWNPHVRSGAPLLATAVVGLLYPPNWLLLCFDDPAAGLGLQCYASLAIAGLLMLGLLRALGLDALPALFGALAFAFSGTFYANAHFYQRLAALIWLPGMLWATHRLGERSGWARAAPLAGLTACTALTWLAGFPSYAAAATLVWGVFAAAHCWRRGRAAGARRAAHLAGVLGVGLALGLAAAAVQLLPMFAFFPESNRTTTPGLREISERAYDVAGWLGYLLPDPFGHPADVSLPYDKGPLQTVLFHGTDWESGRPRLPRYNFTEYTVFPGTLTLLLALGGALVAQPLRRAAVLSLLLLAALAVGALPGAAYLLPGLRNVPPLRFMGPAAALVAVLAAVGLHSAGRGAGRARWRLLALLAAALAGLCAVAYAWLDQYTPQQLRELVSPHLLAHYRQMLPDLTPEGVDAHLEHGRYFPAAQQRLLGNLSYAGIAMTLAAAWLALVPWAAAQPARRYALQGIAVVATAAQLAWLATGVSGGRVLRHDLDTEVHDFLAGQRAAAAGRGGFTVARGAPAVAPPTALPPCTLVPAGIRDLNAYTFVDGRSHLPFERLWGVEQLIAGFWINALPDNALLQHPYLDLLGVRYVLAAQPLRHAGRRVGPTVRTPSGAEGFFVYERPSALPRAFTVGAVRELPDDAAVVDALVAASFAPRDAVLVTPDQRDLLPPLPAAPGTGGVSRAVRFELDTPTDVCLQLEAGPPGYLVMTDTYMSGWACTVDGEPCPIARVNLHMRAIPVPGRAATVRWRYHTPRLAQGACLSAMALAAVVALALCAARHRRNPQASPT